MYGTQFMLDIETTGLDAEKNRITSIAVVPFVLASKSFLNHQDYLHIALVNPLGDRREDDANTVAWRANNTKINIIESKLLQHTVNYGLMEFIDFIDEHKTENSKIWAKPIIFDMLFITSYCNQYDVKLPLTHRDYYDVNTYMSAAGINPYEWFKNTPFNGTPHNALDDCRHQIKGVHAAFRQLSQNEQATQTLDGLKDNRSPTWADLYTGSYEQTDIDKNGGEGN